MNNDIHNKALGLILAYKMKREKIEDCLMAGICPECGSLLNTEKRTEVKKAVGNKLFFWSYRPEKVTRTTQIVCSNNCDIGIYKYPNNNIYRRCINKEIQEASRSWKGIKPWV